MAWRIREATLKACILQGSTGIKNCFILFIVSEVMFFFGFFWAFFILPYLLQSIGCIWPLMQLPLNALGTPLVNTCIYFYLVQPYIYTFNLLSGILVKHYRILWNILYAGLFTIFKVRICICSFAISDGIYGSVSIWLLAYTDFMLLSEPYLF